MLFKRYNQHYGLCDTYKSTHAPIPEVDSKLFESKIDSMMENQSLLNSKANNDNVKTIAEQRRKYDYINSPKENPLFIMRVEITHNRFGIIKVTEDDCPTELAEQFCLDYKLEDQLIDKLSMIIASCKQKKFPQNDCEENRGRSRSRERKSVLFDFNRSKDRHQHSQSQFKSVISTQPSSIHNIDNFDTEENEFMLSMSPQNLRMSPQNLRRSPKNNDLNYSRKNAQSPKAKPRYSYRDQLNSGQSTILRTKYDNALTSQATSPRVTNKGEELYSKGMRYLEQQKFEFHKKKKEEILKSHNHLTFNPNISSNNKLHKRVKSHIKPNGGYQKVLQEKEQLRESLKSQRQEVIKKQCPFKPKTNKISNALVRHRSLDGSNKESAHQNLYKMAGEKKEKRDKLVRDNEIMIDCTFKPLLYKTPEKIEKTLAKETQLERASKHMQRKSQRMEKQAEIQNLGLGKQFKPKIGRPPNEKKRDDRVSIHEHLYNYRNVYDSNKKAKEICNNDEKRPKSPDYFINDLSDNIVDALINNKLGRLFKILDSKLNEGYLAAEDIEGMCETFNDIPDMIMDVFYKMTNKLKEESALIDIQNFIAFFRMTLNSHPAKILAILKSILGDGDDTKKETPRHSFKVNFYF